MAHPLIHEKQRHKAELHVEPRLGEVSRNVKEHANAKGYCQNRRGPSDGKPKSAFHDSELGDERLADRTWGLVLCFAVVHEQAKHVEQTCKPRHDENDVQGLE